MAEEGEGEGRNLLPGAIGVIVLLAVFAGWLTSFTFFDDERNFDEDTGLISISRLIPAGDLSVGTRVINKQVNNIRQQVGGAIIGTQDKRQTGTILEGPVGRFGSTWWRVDYPDAPDGWVEEKSITSKVFTLRAINIFPILYDNFLRPVGIVLTIVLILVFVIIRFLQSGAAAQEEKIQSMRKERAMAYYKPEIEKTEQVVDETGDVPSNLPTGESIPNVQEHSASNVKNERWENVKKLMQSHSENDWKQAILEADIILDSMVERMGYSGATLFDKLQQIEQSDFVTLESAFEGHRFRNKVAHSGVEFKITRDEAERIISLYEKVFQEFYYI